MVGLVGESFVCASSGPRPCGRRGHRPARDQRSSPWGLSSVGRAPALQAGCHRFESVRLHHSSRHDQTAPFAVLSRPVGRGFARSLLTSFREIISVIGCIRVWIRCQYDPSGSDSNNGVVQVKYTNQMRLFLHGNGAECPFRMEGAGNVHAFDRKRPPRAAKGRGARDCEVFLLPDQIKRDKGVWWMPWQ